jgi:hypothetical protein
VFMLPDVKHYLEIKVEWKLKAKPVRLIEINFPYAVSCSCSSHRSISLLLFLFSRVAQMCWDSVASRTVEWILTLLKSKFSGS